MALPGSPCRRPYSAVSTNQVLNQTIGRENYRARSVTRRLFAVLRPLSMRLSAAWSLQFGPPVCLLAVLGFQLDDPLDRPFAEILRGDQEAVLAARQRHRELRDRDVGDAAEGGADA